MHGFGGLGANKPFGAAGGAPQPGAFGAVPAAQAPFGAFAAGQAAPAAGFGFGQPQQQQQQQPAANQFGMFGQPAAAPPAFGAFGAQPAQGAGGFFGAGLPAAGAPGANAFPGAPKPAAPLFGAPPAPAAPAWGAGGMFGAPPPAQPMPTFGAPAAGGVAGMPAFGLAGGGMLGGAAAPGLGAGEPGEEKVLDKIPADWKLFIDSIHAQYLHPMTEGLQHMEKGSKGRDDRMHAELSAIRVAVLKLQTRQEQLVAQVTEFQAESRQQSADALRHGAQELDAVRKGQAAYGNHRFRDGTERLPSEFFRQSLTKLEGRLVRVGDDISEFRQLLESSFRAVEGAGLGGMGGVGGMYGQRVRVGAAQLVAVIQRQNEAFLRIAATVAELHANVEEVRRAYLDLDLMRGQPNPFDQADKAERREQLQREREEQRALKKLEDGGAAEGAAGGGFNLAANSAAVGLPGYTGAPPTTAAVPAFNLGGAAFNIGGAFGAPAAGAPAAAPAGFAGFTLAGGGFNKAGDLAEANKGKGKPKSK